MASVILSVEQNTAQPYRGPASPFQPRQVMSKETLFEATQRLLKNYPRHYSLSQIARESGLKPSWLSAFSRNAIPDPGIHKVQQLYNWLVVDRPLTAMSIRFGELCEKLPNHKLTEKTTTVYLVYRNQECLYVGKSGFIRSRILGHSKMPDFLANFATHIDLVFFDIDSAAATYEKDRIQKYQPKLNFVHSNNVPAPKPIV